MPSEHYHLLIVIIYTLVTHTYNTSSIQRYSLLSQPRYCCISIKIQQLIHDAVWKPATSSDYTLWNIGDLVNEMLVTQVIDSAINTRCSVETCYFIYFYSVEYW